MKTLIVALLLVAGTASAQQSSGVKMINYVLVQQQQAVDSVLSARQNQLETGMVTMSKSLLRCGVLTVSVLPGRKEIAIPHGLTYAPPYYFAHVLSPGGTGNAEIKKTATGITVVLPTAPLVTTPYSIAWQFQ